MSISFSLATFHTRNFFSISAPLGLSLLAQYVAKGMDLTKRTSYSSTATSEFRTHSHNTYLSKRKYIYGRSFKGIHLLALVYGRSMMDLQSFIYRHCFSDLADGL